MARGIICTIVDYNSVKSKQIRELKENFQTYGYSEKPVEIRIQKALRILKQNHINKKQK